jgi:hypothetical protein
MFSQWQLGEFDFNYTGQAVGPIAIPMQMRSQLTSNFPTGLVEKILKFLDTDPTLSIIQRQDLQATVGQLAGADVMVQSLTGFNQWMLSKIPQATQPVTDLTVAQWTSDIFTWVPDSSNGTPPVFDPLRAGHFRITNLRVIDAYGQVFNGAVLDGAVLPIRSQALLPNFGTDQSLMQVVPRVAQSMRLNLQLLQRDNDKQLSNSSDSTSPICGWLLPNHLNESLAVYDDQGVAIGEVIKVIRDSGAGLRWDPSPGTDGVLGGAPQIANDHLLQIVRNLLRLGMTTTEPLDQLFDLIDVTLWSTDALGPLNSGNLSLLLGRPIAVVRASASFELQGNPSYQQDWASTGQLLDDGFPAVSLPLRIGDFKYSNNGSLAYFLNDDYSSCYAMYNYQPSMGALRRGLRAPIPMRAEALRQHVAAARLAAKNEPSQTTALTAQTPAYVKPGLTMQLPCGGSQQALLTVLVDPRGGVTASTGTAPFQTVTLPNGPVDAALSKMQASFRMGPLLLDEEKIQLPLPTGVSGKWNWIERSGVTFWREEGPLTPSDQTARMPDQPPSLREGWLTLGSAFSDKGNTQNG